MVGPAAAEEMESEAEMTLEDDLIQMERAMLFSEEKFPDEIRGEELKPKNRVSWSFRLALLLHRLFGLKVYVPLGKNGFILRTWIFKFLRVEQKIRGWWRNR